MSLSVVQYGANNLLDMDHPLHRGLREERVRTLLDDGESAAAAAALTREVDVHAAVALFLRATGHEAAQVGLQPNSSKVDFIVIVLRQANIAITMHAGLVGRDQQSS